MSAPVIIWTAAEVPEALALAAQLPSEPAWVAPVVDIATGEVIA